MTNDAVATELELLRGIFYYDDGLVIEEKGQEQEDGNENENEEASFH